MGSGGYDKRAGRSASGSPSMSQSGNVLGGFPRFAQRAHAAGANVQADTHTVHHDTLVLHIGAKIAIGATFGETHVFAKSLRLATDITFTGHGGPPFKGNRRETDVSDGIQLYADCFQLPNCVRGVKSAPSRDDAYPRPYPTTVSKQVQTICRLQQAVHVPIGERVCFRTSLPSLRVRSPLSLTPHRHGSIYGKL